MLKAQCVKNGKMTAMKCMKETFESEEQVEHLREIQALRRLSPHPGVIKLIEVLYEQVHQAKPSLGPHSPDTCPSQNDYAHIFFYMPRVPSGYQCLSRPCLLPDSS